MRMRGIAVSLAGLLAGCGVIYEPQTFDPPGGGYGYHRTDHVDIEVIPLTFTATQVANADGYRPRGLPDVFGDIDPIVDISTRERIAAAGLDTVDPALQFDPLPASPRTYDPGQEILPPVMRREDLAPAPTLSLQSGGVDARLDAGYASARGSDAPLPNLYLENAAPPSRPTLNPPPRTEATPYRIGTGDVIFLISDLQPILSNGTGEGALADATKRLLVQDNGEIFIPQAGSVAVAGLTLDEARQVIFERLINNQIDFDFGVEIGEFGSQKVSVSGPSSATMLPVTMRPITLGEAVVAGGGLGTDPGSMVVRVLRQGRIYEVPGAELQRSSDLAGRILRDGDMVSIESVYNLEKALGYFDGEMRARDWAKAQISDAREQVQFDIAMENYRLEAERLRQEAAIARFAAEREADQAREEARLANITARQEYLDRLRALLDANQTALRATERERRETLRANISERSREREERRALLELELQEERARLEQQIEQRAQARALFEKRVALGAVERDYVTIAGEVGQQTTFPLPFDGRVTLNRIIYEAGRGPSVATGDTSEIYVIRRPIAGAKVERLVAYHLDASNAANLAVATAFEMRPHDVVFVNPQPVTNWNRVIAQLLPSTSFLLSTATGASNLGSN